VLAALGLLLHFFPVLGRSRGWVGNSSQINRAVAKQGGEKMKVLLLRVAGMIWSLLLKLAGLLYPPTKAKLHRLLHMVGTIVAAIAIAGPWMLVHGIAWDTALELNAVTVALVLTNLRLAISKLDAGVDGLPIPTGSGEDITQTLRKPGAGDS
jgi:hypothetical protein